MILTLTSVILMLTLVILTFTLVILTFTLVILTFTLVILTRPEVNVMEGPALVGFGRPSYMYATVRFNVM